MKSEMEISVNFTVKEMEKLKNLMTALDTYYQDEEEMWDFQSVDEQRQIAVEMANILERKF